ncbi:hypothetical protein RFI_33355, partial [Reticulomyxa filosa]
MLKSLIEFSKHIEKNRNPYEIVSKLCNLFEWLENVPVTFIPNVRICCTASFEGDAHVHRHKARTNSNLEPLLSVDESSGNETNHDNDHNDSHPSGGGNDDKKHELKKTNEQETAPGPEDYRARLVNSQFQLANACLKCISEYVSYHDVHPILQRAILPRLLKASGFHHKKYLLYAGLIYIY